MIWPFVAVPAAGLATWFFWPAEKTKSSIQHLVPRADEHLVPVTPQHQPALLTRLKNEGPAVASAKTLYRALRAGTAPAVLVAAFQHATNSDPASIRLVGPISPTGVYDPRTSAALTMYTEDPIPAHPSVPDAPHPMTPATVQSSFSPGNAALAGSNLYVYLLTHGKDGSTALDQLTRRFQTAVNTDPKFPGPACKNGLPILIPDRLKIDGIPGPKTLRALGVITPTQVRV